MNTTMADGARERCVAQIGEALFAQPGLTLMELAEKVKASQPTPSSRWAANGEPDPHGSHYDCERAALVMGDLSDDELANAVFLHGNEQPTMAQMAAGAMLPVAYLTAAKDRIRWLSRALVAASAKNATLPSPAGQGDAPWPEIDMILADAHSAGAEGLQFEGIARRAAVRVAVAALAPQPVQGWVVADGQGKRWRMWGSYGPAWTSHRDEALHFARRADAEAFANDDEDAWLIQPVGTPAQIVDLGQLTRYEPVGSDGMNMESMADGRWVKLDDVLALIDSKVVGNGQ